MAAMMTSYLKAGMSRMQARMSFLRSRMPAALKKLGSRGQNTVEYLMMLAVVVGVILVIGKMFKPQISGIFNQVMAMISNATTIVGGTSGS